MKKGVYLALLIALQACDAIDQLDRSIEMDEVIPQKNVLLLDFTDQLCINCPEAATIIDTLQDNYGDALIAVSIHSSPLVLPLVTSEGKEYDQHFGINFTHPSAVIDGLDKYQKDQWGGTALTRFNVHSRINLDLSTSYDASTHEIDIESIISNSTLSGNLKYQLWLLEDSIVDYQKISSKDYNDYYVHNHVFRTSINGTWGEDFSVADEKEEKNLRHTFTVSDSTWAPDHLSVVGFIYNASSDEVYEVKQSHINKQITD